MIKRIDFSSLILSAVLLTATSTVFSQTSTPNAPAARSEVRMERDDFLKAHRYDENERDWIAQGTPSGNLPRAEVKVARDQFLSLNRWDNQQSAFVPIQGTPRVLGSMSREEVKMESMEFLRAYSWDNRESKWVMRPSR